jgi:hypothetical protein
MKVVLKAARDHVAHNRGIEARQTEKAWRREIMVSLHLNHPNVLAAFGLVHDALPDGRLCIVYPEMPYDNISSYVRDARPCNPVELVRYHLLP